MKQDGAASESSSSRGRIVRKFSCQEIRHWSLDFGHWILELRHWTLELVHWTLKCCNSVVMFWKYCDRDVMWFDIIVCDSVDQFSLIFPSSFRPLKAEIGCLCTWNHGTSVSDEIDQKMRVGQKTCFFLRFFPPSSFRPLKAEIQAACAPGDYGDHGTSVSDKIDQKMKVDQNTWFFLRFFSPAHFVHGKLR